MILQSNKIVIRRPDDWHLHLRDGDLLKLVLPYSSSTYSRAIIMPNLISPIVDIKSGIDYRKLILSNVPNGHIFSPLMTCYLTEVLDPDELEQAFFSGIFTAVKMYPLYSTTNSSYGVNKINNITKILERLQKIQMPLLVHCEVTDFNIDIFDREARFIDDIMHPLRKQFPELKIVMEHISTKEAVEYVESSDNKVGATITPHHLILNRNDLLVHRINPHFYCFPILKSKVHQEALRKAISNGNSKFFLGTDSAPHIINHKENSQVQAGIFNAPTALSVYATVFEELNALRYFESFCSENGPRFYNLPLNQDTITLIRKPWKIKNTVNLSPYSLVTFLVGNTLNWFVEN
ncbi:dihydroorotase [Candidatus Pantoea edessiphila]|uniref:Dihydroorotase n=1 Tax=Candidatus Pantoea edessiphila TaxID=2044610 RepID=A0A2P5SYZ7_9GAMM|nr:dihydroorotase [Candidatus Pantoea edessiphila]MBK4775344.1 dihydroorotase [Pantoea sp. Edef]PPI87522.1 dihydroorotase [Candidatus Pantoea edessiphila]